MIFQSVTASDVPQMHKRKFNNMELHLRNDDTVETVKKALDFYKEEKVNLNVVHFPISSKFRGTTSPVVFVNNEGLEDMKEIVYLLDKEGFNNLGFVLHFNIVHEEKFEKILYSEVLKNIGEIRDFLVKVNNSYHLYLENLPVYFFDKDQSNPEKRIGMGFIEINKMIDELGEENLGICLDTCHMFSDFYACHNHEEIDLDTKNEIKKAYSLSLYDNKEIDLLKDIEKFKHRIKHIHLAEAYQTGFPHFNHALPFNENDIRIFEVLDFFKEDKITITLEINEKDYMNPVNFWNTVEVLRNKNYKL